MKKSIAYAALALLIVAQGRAVAVTYPYTTTPGTSDTTKTTTKPATTTTTPSTTTKTTTPSKTTKPAAPASTVKKTTPKPATKPAPPPEEESFFSDLSYGVALISQSADVANIATNSSSSESGTGIGVFADKFYKNKYRFNGTLSYVSYDNFITTSLTFAADYLVPINSNIALFGGVAAGGAGQKYSSSSFSDMSLALVYGAQLGGIMVMSDSMMLELGYRLRMTNLETEITTTPASTDTIDQLDEAYLSLIFSF